MPLRIWVVGTRTSSAPAGNWIVAGVGVAVRAPAGAGAVAGARGAARGGAAAAGAAGVAAGAAAAGGAAVATAWPPTGCPVRCDST